MYYHCVLLQVWLILQRISGCSVERELFGVSNCYCSFNVYCTTGVEVTCTGNTGHGSAFIKDTAMEKLVSTNLLYVVIESTV